MTQTSNLGNQPTKECMATSWLIQKMLPAVLVEECVWEWVVFVSHAGGEHEGVMGAAGT